MHLICRTCVLGDGVHLQTDIWDLLAKAKFKGMTGVATEYTKQAVCLRDEAGLLDLAGESGHPSPNACEPMDLLTAGQSLSRVKTVRLPIFSTSWPAPTGHSCCPSQATQADPRQDVMDIPGVPGRALGLTVVAALWLLGLACTRYKPRQIGALNGRGVGGSSVCGWPHLHDLIPLWDWHKA